MSKDILFPLRRLHGQLHENAALRRQFKNCQVLIPGTPEHTNLGDSAIVLAQIAFLERCGFPSDRIQEISFSEYPRYFPVIRRSIPKNALIAQLGGGNMGSQWKLEENFHRRVVTDFPTNPMVIFPQTIYYSPEAQDEAENSKDIYGGHQKLILVAREKVSLSVMDELYSDAQILLTPDIVLSATMDTFGAKPQKREGILLCMRTDAERSITDGQRDRIEQAVRATAIPFRYTGMHTTGRVTKDTRTTRVREKMEELASAQLVITDRLHGMIFATLTGTPCIVFSNYNHKVKGTYEWIKYLPYIRYVETAEEAESFLPELLAMGGQKYENTPLQSHFDELTRVVKKYANN